MKELAALYRRIRTLSPTQSAGFEGLVRDLFAEVTGQGFRLMKSGPQGGVDVLGDSVGTGLVIGIEGKHYAERTKLPLDQLKSKIRDATARFPEMEMWVLATTRPMSQGDVRELEDVGTRDGVDTLVLDWDQHASQPPDLAILCAMAPHSTRTRLGSSPSIDRALDWLLKHPAYPQASTRLRQRLTDPRVGYGAARAAMATWMRVQMQNVEAARLAFDSYATLLGPERHRIGRATVSTQLDQWWSSSYRSPAVLLGEEGVGKTWAALGWWLQKSDADSAFPLTVVLPAKSVSSTDVDALLAQALFNCFDTRSVVFWEKRVRRWLAADSVTPSLLVIVDGLNQNWMFRDWSEFALRAAGANRRGKVGLLLTVRPDHFAWRMGRLVDLPVKPIEIKVGPFDNAELRDVLATYALCLADFDGRLLQLLRVPRLCHRAVKRRKELENCEDITPERLIYEDWRDRQPTALRVMSNESFREFLAGLAQKIKADHANASITRKELLNDLSMDSGDATATFEGVLSEIVDGRWLVATEHLHQFKVDPERLPFALGLALVSELEGVTSEQQARVVLDTAFDVYQGLDVGVRILRCASTFAMMESTVAEVVRQSILSYWLEAQNFGSADFETLWRCLGASPASVLDVAERSWFGSASRRSQDEILVKAFGNSFRWTAVATACEARLTQWFERYWLDPLVGEVLGTVPDDDRARVRKAATQSRALIWSTAAGPCPFDVRAKEVDAQRQAWGGFRAIEMLSWLPRKPLLRPITAWAITRAIMGMFRQEDKFAWILRWNESDPVEAESAILDRAAELVAFGSVGVDAAKTLLKALATRKAEAALALLGTEPSAATDSPPSPNDDPMNPSCVASADYVASLRSMANSLADDELRQEALDRARPATTALQLSLARWAPDARLLLERRRIRLILDEIASNGASAAEAQQLLLSLHVLVSVMGEQEILQWKHLARTARQAGQEWNWALQLGALVNECPTSQIELLSQAPKKSMPKAVTAALVPVDLAACVSLCQKFASGLPEEEVLYWLAYLSSTSESGAELQSAGVDVLLIHPSALVREKALQLALRDDGGFFGDKLFASDWSWRQANSVEERAFGSVLLAQSNHGSNGELADRVHPEVLGHLVEKFPAQGVYVSEFADYVRAELLELQTAKSRSIPHAMLLSHRGWSQLVDKRGDDLEKWLQPFLHNEGRRLLGGFGETFPLLEAIEAVSPRNPALSAKLMSALLTQDASSGFRMGGLQTLALRLKSDDAQIVRQFVLSEANNDEKLYDFAAGLEKTGQRARLIEAIELDLASEMAGHVARGLALAGFLMPSRDADELWCTPLVRVPSHGWLSVVANTAKGRYARAVASFHWFDAFALASSDDEAFAHFELFLSTVDPRFLASGKFRQSRPFDWPIRRRMHWGLGVEAINGGVKKVLEGWKGVFLCTTPPLNNQFPIRR